MTNEEIAKAVIDKNKEILLQVLEDLLLSALDAKERNDWREGKGEIKPPETI